ncbi:MAG: hypothetical protein U0694_04260 [Anaerolineae bacterium]
MENVFENEWRECLQVHYRDIVRANDQKTLKSLLTVMNEVGFRDEELREMAVLATAHVDDVPDDFVPDLNILEPEAQVPAEAAAPASEEAAPPKKDPKEPKQLSLF